MRLGAWIGALCGIGLGLAAGSVTAKPPQPTAVRAAPRIVASAAVVLDLASGRWLYQRNADARMYPASTTKVLTAILAIESGRMDDTVTVRWEDLQVVPSILGLERGERIMLRDLVYGLLLQSGNDAARAIARHLAGSQAAFAQRMNARARAIGCRGSHFVNAHGLPHRAHYTTARDLALIMQHAMSLPEFRRITATPRHRATTSRRTLYFHNKNRLLGLYPGATGGKPGYTRAAQQTLVAAAARQERELVVVCLHSRGRAIWQDAMRLFDFGFAQGSRPHPSGAAALSRVAATPRDED